MEGGTGHVVHADRKRSVCGTSGHGCDGLQGGRVMCDRGSMRASSTGHRLGQRSMRGIANPNPNLTPDANPNPNLWAPPGATRHERHRKACADQVASRDDDRYDARLD